MELTDGTPTPWRSRALCSILIKDGSVPADLWFSEDPEESAAAAGACFNCPVRQQCLQAAVQGKEEHGIWGGQPVFIRILNGRHRAYSSLKNLPNPYGGQE